MSYDLSIGTHRQYEREIAEIDFRNYFTLLISQEEKLGKFCVVAVSMRPDQVEDYGNGRNDPSKCVPLEELEAAIKEAKEKLLAAAASK